MSRSAKLTRSLLPLGALLLLTAFVPACGEGETAPDRLGGTSSLRGALSSASRETGVPPELLAALAHVESRLHPEARGDGDHGAPGQGLLQLVRGSGPRSLERGARLAGVAPGLTGVDLQANLRAGAHLLAEHGRRTGSRPAELRSWYDAVSAYGGGELDPETGRLLADAVFKVLREGLTV